MLNSKFDSKTIILLLLCIFLLIRNCSNKGNNVGEKVNINGKKYELVKKETDTVIKIVKETTIVYKPKLITRVEKEIIKVPADVDTLAILKDFYTKYQYRDTVLVSSYGKGIISDIITQNQIVGRQIEWDLNIPSVKETITVKESPKTQVYYGFNLGLNKTDVFNNASGGLILKTKKDYLYQLNLGFQPAPDSKINPYLGVGMYWKINLNKK